MENGTNERSKVALDLWRFLEAAGDDDEHAPARSWRDADIATWLAMDVEDIRRILRTSEGWSETFLRVDPGSGAYHLTAGGVLLLCLFLPGKRGMEFKMEVVRHLCDSHAAVQMVRTVANRLNDRLEGSAPRLFACLKILE